MKIIEDLRCKLASIGGELDEYEAFFCLDAPSGYVWNCNGTPTVTIQYANGGGQTWLAEAMRHEIKNLLMGLRLATTDELIEIRWSNDDDAWGAPEGSPERLEWPKR